MELLQRVRVTLDDNLRRRGTVLCIHAENGTCEIEFDDGTEAVVPMTSTQPLLEWERAGSGVSTAGPSRAEELKAQGNELFKLRDAEAALQRYMSALRELSCPLTPGSRCLVKPVEGNGAARAALVLTLDPDGAALDVEYEPNLHAAASRAAVSERLSHLLRQATVTAQSEEQCRREEEAEDGMGEVEEDGVARSRVVLVVHPTHGSLQVAVLLNMAKCSLLSRDYGAALARAGRAERIAANDQTEPARTALMRRTAIIVSARASLGMQSFGAATTHASRLLALPLPTDTAGATAAVALKEGRQLVVDIQRRVTEVRRSNKRLAKELAAWVSAAMDASGQGRAVTE